MNRRGTAYRTSASRARTPSYPLLATCRIGPVPAPAADDPLPARGVGGSAASSPSMLPRYRARRSARACGVAAPRLPSRGVVSGLAPADEVEEVAAAA